MRPDSENSGFTRAACAELLIDAGAVVTPSVCEGLLQSRARGLLQLFQRKGLLPRTLKFLAALGDLDAVRTALDENGNDLATVNEAFVCACRFEHEAVASLLLERCIALDPELGDTIDGSVGPPGLRQVLHRTRGPAARDSGRAVEGVRHGAGQRARSTDGDLTAFVRGLQREPWLLGEACVEFQAGSSGRPR